MNSARRGRSRGDHSLLISLGKHSKSQMDVREVSIPGQHLTDAEFSHHREAREIGERNAGFIGITQAKLVGLKESIRADRLDRQESIALC